MDMKVNDAEWTSLSKDEQSQVEAIITGFFKDAKVVPDKATASSALLKAAATPDSFCVAACNVAQATAAAACLGLGNPIAIAACIALTVEAGKACRDNC